MLPSFHKNLPSLSRKYNTENNKCCQAQLKLKSTKIQLQFRRYFPLQSEVSGLHIRVLHQFMRIPFQNRPTIFKDIPMMNDG